MIFVTVGTHEQPFDRLIKAVDRLRATQEINEEVFIQIGYSDYVPENCNWKKFLGYTEMERYINDASLVITHGGPASFLSVLKHKKVPIVVPRMVEHGEHVNDHQLSFAKKVKDEGYPIIVVEDVLQLKDVIYKNIGQTISFTSNNEKFTQKFISIINNLVGDNR